METNFNFKSQVCTDRFQSERLMELGLKKETADMFYDYCKDRIGYTWYLVPKPATLGDKRSIPAWSLHRLLCLYGADYEIKEVYNNAEECYGMLICAIEIAIENGDFNEEYLEKQWE